MTIGNLDYTNIIFFCLNLLVMQIGEFFSKYADEQNCKEFFKQKREAELKWCMQCGSLYLYWIAVRFEMNV